MAAKRIPKMSQLPISGAGTAGGKPTIVLPCAHLSGMRAVCLYRIALLIVAPLGRVCLFAE